MVFMCLNSDAVGFVPRHKICRVTVNLDIFVTV